MTLDVAKARAQFPILKDGFIFADNAGGSQALSTVALAVADYLVNSNVQLDASYTVSRHATERVDLSAPACRVLVNAEKDEEIVFGHSTTQLLANLARAVQHSTWMTGQEELVIMGEHEANVGPWKRLSAAYDPPLAVKTWFPISSNPTKPLSVTYKDAIPELLSLLSARTRIVALNACSNILGEVLDIKQIVQAIRARVKELGGDERGVLVVVDLVAYAPHRRIDVRQWDVDFAAFSFYKVYGPHCAAMYARQEALGSLGSIAHHFHSPAVDMLPMKLQPGGRGYELNYGAAWVLSYLISLSDPAVPPTTSPTDLIRSRTQTELTDALARTEALVYAHEHQIGEIVLSFLRQAKGVQIVGLDAMDETTMRRAPTISFVVDGKSSRSIVESVDAEGNIGIRWGHFYAYSLVERLRGTAEVVDGVVRVSLVHYNSAEEAECIVAALRHALESSP